MAKTLLVRVDASHEIGIGHIMRCIALSQGWRANGGRVIFITYCENDGLRRRLVEEGFQVVSLEKVNTCNLCDTAQQAFAAHPGAWVILDGYHFGTAYQALLKEKGHKLLVIDDLADLNFYTGDLVLNQNAYGRQLKYTCEPRVGLLLGSDYALLRSEFLDWLGWRRIYPETVQRVLVTFGGSDATKQTCKVIQAINNLDSCTLQVDVIVGANNPNISELLMTVRSQRHQIKVKPNATNMPEQMAWADVALTAGGSTCWELAFMQVPSLVITTASNQRYVAPELQR